MIRLALVLCLAAMLPACATRTYEWDSYDMRLYQYYKTPTSAESFRLAMEANLRQLEAKGLRPAPGLYAELGTLYLEKGDRTTAAVFYGKERDAWPESRFMMDALLANLSKLAKEAGPK